jgi:hypothetical protein
MAVSKREQNGGFLINLIGKKVIIMNTNMLHEFMEGMLPLVVVISLAWIIITVFATLRHRAHLQTQTDFHNKMLDKFGSAEEFTAYLQSEAGQRFFENLASEPSTPLSKILGSIQKGVVLFLLGSGLAILGRSFNPENGGNVMFVIGIISLMIGSGFLVSSVISYRLAKAWDLISAGPRRTSTESKSPVS